VRVFRLLVLIAWMGLVSYWSNQASLPIDRPVVAAVLHNLQHRVAHVLVYGLMGVLAWWAFDGLPRATLLAIAVTSAFGLSDEWHQSFIPGRRAAIDDWLLDTAAAAVAIYVVSRLRASRLEPFLNMVAPAVVCAGFAIGIALAARPALSAALVAMRVHLQAALFQ
jgi:VanZ family protein